MSTVSGRIETLGHPAFDLATMPALPGVLMSTLLTDWRHRST
ncbi:hypothetical protein, partial [Pseudomonas syringae]